LEEYWRELSALPTGELWPNSQLPRAVLEHYPVIDVRVLMRRRLLQPEDLTFWAMSFEPRGAPAILQYFAADTRFGPPHIRVLTLGEQETRQIIRISQDGRGRWKFIDPASKRPCEVLALREGLWASRQSQHLINRSQERGLHGRPTPKQARERKLARGDCQLKLRIG
jgi:hypothetical protein